VRGRLGAAGTFETPGSGGFDWKDAFTTQKLDTEGRGEFQIDPRYTKGTKGGKLDYDIKALDTDKYMEGLEGSAEFRIASRLTAESEQLLKREGKLYEDMQRNLQLPIIEGSAAMARENGAQLQRAMRRGGAARRGAMEAHQQMRQQERINTQKIHALAESNFKLDTWARDNARTQLEFNQNWAKNLGGIREEYNKAMDGASELMASKALPMMFMAKQEAAKWRYRAHAKNREKLGRWINGVVGIASMAVGAWAGGVFGGAGAAAGGANALANQGGVMMSGGGMASVAPIGAQTGNQAPIANPGRMARLQSNLSPYASDFMRFGGASLISAGGTSGGSSFAESSEVQSGLLNLFKD
jgi:hypothetical protein